MTLKDQIKKWFDSCPIKDADETEEEKKAREEAEAKEKEKAMADKRTKDQEEKVGNIEERLSAIEDLLKELLADEGTEDADEEDEEKKKKEEEEAKKKAVEAQDADEEEEKKKKEEEEQEKKETADCAAQWPEFISRADILVPGIEIKKPTRDHRRTMDTAKLQVLAKALSNKETAEVIKPVLAGKTFDSMASDALDVAFVAASELVAAKRNGKIQVGDGSKLKVHDFATARTVADINKANKDFYAKKA